MCHGQGISCDASLGCVDPAALGELTDGPTRWNVVQSPHISRNCSPPAEAVQYTLQP